MPKLKYSIKLMPFLMVPFLVACGGGSSSTATDDPTSDAVTISGQVMDGYLQDARVFLDLNNNGLRDASEPETRSGENGEFSFSTTETIPDDATLIAEAIAGVTIDRDDDQAVPLGYTLRSPLVTNPDVVSAQNANDAQDIDSYTSIISPLTTLISREMIANGRTFEAAADKVSADLGLSIAPEKNYMELKASDDPEIAGNAERAHRISQVLARIQAKQEAQFSGFDFTIGGADKLSFLNTLTENIQAVISSVVADVNLSLQSEDPFDPDSLAEQSGSQLVTTIVAGPDTSSNIYSGEVTYVGFVKGATVFVDRNLNGERDAGEQFTVTDEDGKFAFTTGLVLAGTEIVARISPETSIDSTGAPIPGEFTLYNPIGLYLDNDAFESGLGMLINTQLSPALNLVPRNPDLEASESQFAEAVGTDRQSLLFYARQALSPDREIADEGWKVSRINAEIAELFVRLDDVYGEIDLEANNLTDNQYRLTLRSYVTENLPEIVSFIETSSVEQVVPGEVLDSINLDLIIPGLYELINPEDPGTEDPVDEEPGNEDPGNDIVRPDYTPGLRLFALSTDFTQSCAVSGERVDIHDGEMNLVETRRTDSSGAVDLSDVPQSQYVTVYGASVGTDNVLVTYSSSYEMSFIDAPHTLQLQAERLYDGSLTNCEPLLLAPPENPDNFEFDISVSNGGSFDFIEGSSSPNGYVGFSQQPTDGVLLASAAQSSVATILLLGKEVTDGSFNSLPTSYFFQEDVDISDGLVQATIANPVESITKPIEPTLTQISSMLKPLDSRPLLSSLFTFTGAEEASTRISIPTVIQGQGILQITRRYREDSFPSTWVNQVYEPLLNDGRSLTASAYAGLSPFSQVGSDSDANAMSYSIGDVPFDAFALRLNRSDDVYPSADSDLANRSERFERSVVTSNMSGTINFPDIVTDDVYLGTSMVLSVFSAENANSLPYPLAEQYGITSGVMPVLGLDLEYAEQPEYRGQSDYNDLTQAFLERRFIESSFQKLNYNDPLVFNAQ
ncbi:hypothetical protein [Marinobacter sp. SS13-12]|uniref:hypothetical protein n=1 Tax=Marinobacter sp. SS13-12 TaxID=3050451 RepID=UPI002555C906|nr:hypothetical protein [Marinobacter sp. SS13-12]MDK8465904.1 hypothetical protein [Marinobacter sp. SS13-12]